jgi:DNA replication protein DnaC
VTDRSGPSTNPELCSVRRFAAAAPVKELVEAEGERERSKSSAAMAGSMLCLGELGHLHLDRRGAERLLQVLTERDERASIAVASIATFSEWGQTHSHPRLAAAVVDRLTFRAHMVGPGRSRTASESQPDGAEGRVRAA